MTRDRPSTLAVSTAAAIASLIASCADPALSIRDLEALHSTVDGRLRHRYLVELHDDFDRLFAAIPGLSGVEGLVAPKAYELEDPAAFCRDRLLELRAASPDDPETFAAVLYWAAFFARLEPAALSREAAVRVFASFVPALHFRAFPRQSDAEADLARRRLVEIVGQLAADVVERRRVVTESRSWDEDLVRRHIATMLLLGDVRAPDFTAGRQVLQALRDLAAAGPPSFLDPALQRTVRAVGADVLVLVVRSAFQRSSERERDGFVQAALLHAYLALGGADALREIAGWLPPTAESAAVRAVVEDIRTHGFDLVVEAGVVPWFLGWLDAPDDTVRLNVQAVLRDRSGRSFEDSGEAAAWWAKAGSATPDARSS